MSYKNVIFRGMWVSVCNVCMYWAYIEHVFHHHREKPKKGSYLQKRKYLYRVLANAPLGRFLSVWIG